MKRHAVCSIFPSNHLKWKLIRKREIEKVDSLWPEDLDCGEWCSVQVRSHIYIYKTKYMYIYIYLLGTGRKTVHQCVKKTSETLMWKNQRTKGSYHSWDRAQSYSYITNKPCNPFTSFSHIITSWWNSGNKTSFFHLFSSLFCFSLHGDQYKVGEFIGNFFFFSFFFFCFV